MFYDVNWLHVGVHLLVLSYHSFGGDVVLVVVVASYDELCCMYCDSEMTCCAAGRRGWNVVCKILENSFNWFSICLLLLLWDNYHHATRLSRSIDRRMVGHIIWYGPSFSEFGCWTRKTRLTQRSLNRSSFICFFLIRISVIEDKLMVPMHQTEYVWKIYLFGYDELVSDILSKCSGRPKSTITSDIERMSTLSAWNDERDVRRECGG